MKRWRPTVIDREFAAEAIDEANALTPSNPPLTAEAFYEPPRKRRRWWLALAVLGGCALLWFSAHALVAVLLWVPIYDPDLHVATTGSDVTGNGNAFAPWATPQHAIDQIRLRGLNVGLSANQNIIVEPGTYPAISLVTADSGVSSGARMNWKCNGAALSCIISGGTAVDTSTCATYSGNVQRCVVPAGSNFYTLFENGERAVLARPANIAVNPIWPDAQAPYFISTSSPGSSSHTVLGYSSGDVDLSTVVATDISIIGMAMGFGIQSEWWYEQDPVTSINTGAHQVTLAHEMRYYTYDGFGARYMFQGDLSWLDTVGEWYLDRNDNHGSPGGGKHYLYIYPTTTPIANDGLVYPTTQDTAAFAGTDAAHQVHDIAFDGFWFRYSDAGPWFRFANAWGAQPPGPPWPPGTSTGSDWDNAQGAGHEVTPYATVETPTVMRHGLASFKNATRITFTNSRFSNSGFSCMYAYLGTDHISTSGSWIDRCGYDGVEWEGGYPREGDQNNHHTLSNSYVERVGELFGGASGIDVLNSGHHTVSHVTVKRSKRASLIVFSDCTLDPTTCYGQGSTFDHIALDTCAEDSADVGCMYSSAIPDNPNTYDQFEVGRAFKEPSLRFVSPFPVYLDAQSGGNSTNGQTLTNFDIRGAFHDNTGGQTFTYGNNSWATSGTPCTLGQTYITGGTACAFTTTLMDYANIGFTSAFPFISAVNAENAFSENFEGGPLAPAWTQIGAGTPHLSTTQSHSATHSFVVDAANVVIGKVMPTGLRQTYTVWFYDDTTQTSMESCARADRIDLTTGSSGTYDTNASRGICASKSHSAGFYSTWIDNGFATTGVARVTGWHKFTWDYTDGVHAKMGIDGVQVASPTGLREFDVVSMGAYSAAGFGTSYFDDASVQ